MSASAVEIEPSPMLATVSTPKDVPQLASVTIDPMVALRTFCNEVSESIFADSGKSATREMDRAVSAIAQTLDTVSLRLDELESVSLKESFKSQLTRTGDSMDLLSDKTGELEACFAQIEALERGVKSVERSLSESEARMKHVNRHIELAKSVAVASKPKAQQTSAGFWGSLRHKWSFGSAKESATAEFESVGPRSPDTVSPRQLADQLAATDPIVIGLEWEPLDLFREDSLFGRPVAHSKSLLP